MAKIKPVKRGDKDEKTGRKATSPGQKEETILEAQGLSILH
jgi:hypothetical protein